MLCCSPISAWYNASWDVIMMLSSRILMHSTLLRLPYLFLLNRAAIYLEQGMQDKAYVDYCQVMDVDKKNTEALLMRAYIYMLRRGL